MFKKILGLAATAALALGATSAQAVTITGSIGFAGSAAATGGTNLSNANKIDFAGGNPGLMSVMSASGDFSVFSFLTPGSIKDLTFAPFSGPINGFYTVTSGGNTLTFDLKSLSIASQTLTFLNLTGTGTMHLTGKDDTDGTWSFSVTTTDPSVFTWSSTSANVPEPATLGLLGAGLMGLGLVRRRRKA